MSTEQHKDPTETIASVGSAIDQIFTTVTERYTAALIKTEKQIQTAIDSPYNPFPFTGRAYLDLRRHACASYLWTSVTTTAQARSMEAGPQRTRRMTDAIMHRRAMIEAKRTLENPYTGTEAMTTAYNKVLWDAEDEFLRDTQLIADDQTALKAAFAALGVN